MAAPAPGRRPILRDLMLLIAGLAFGLWLILENLRGTAQPRIGAPDRWLAVVVFGLGGLSIVGPPLLIAERWRRRRAGEKRAPRWGPGRLLWFTQGTASWLLWPPIVIGRVRGRGVEGSSATCFLYGTPLTALYVGAALLFGGWFGRRGRRAAWRSWRERFGLILALAWACTGLYVLYEIYSEDLGR